MSDGLTGSVQPTDDDVPDVVRKTKKSGRRKPVDNELIGYAVVHEVDLGRDEPHYGVASSIHRTRENAENSLAVCHSMQERGLRGSDGRYFIAEVREVSDE